MACNAPSAGWSHAAHTAPIAPASGYFASSASICARESAMPPSCTSGVTRSSTSMSGVLAKIASATTPLACTGGNASNTNITTPPSPPRRSVT